MSKVFKLCCIGLIYSLSLPLSLCAKGYTGGTPVSNHMYIDEGIIQYKGGDDFGVLYAHGNNYQCTETGAYSVNVNLSNLNLTSVNNLFCYRTLDYTYYYNLYVNSDNTATLLNNDNGYGNLYIFNYNSLSGSFLNRLELCDKNSKYDYTNCVSFDNGDTCIYERAYSYVDVFTNCRSDARFQGSVKLIKDCPTGYSDHGFINPVYNSLNNNIYFIDSRNLLYRVNKNDVMNLNDNSAVCIGNANINLGTDTKAKYLGEGYVAMLSEKNLCLIDRYNNIKYLSVDNYGYGFSVSNVCNNKIVVMYNSDRQDGRVATCVEYDLNLNELSRTNVMLPYIKYEPGGKSRDMCASFDLGLSQSGDLILLYGVKYPGSMSTPCHLVKFDKIPASCNISPVYSNIGDNTNGSINITASESVPLIGVYNADSGECLYYGNYLSNFEYNMGSSGNINFIVKMFNSTGNFINQSNICTVYKRDILNEILGKSIPQKAMSDFFIVDGSDRFFDNNEPNRLLVQKLKDKNVYFIYNNISDVLRPLVK